GGGSGGETAEGGAEGRRPGPGGVPGPGRRGTGWGGEGDPPVSIRVARSWLISSICPVTTPPVTSEWPPMYLVAEWITRSAPCSSGRQITGGARVESTTSSAPPLCAISASLRRSGTAVVGLAIVSAYTIGVAGRIAARTASRSEISTKSVSTPNRASMLRSRLYVPPYTAEEQTTCAPARRNVHKTPEIAAIPDENPCAAGHRERLAPS